MALVKVKNNGQTVLFIESLGAIVRPFKSNGDFILVDEDKAKLDVQFVNCVMKGAISVFTLDGKEWTGIKKETQVKKEKRVSKKTTPINNKTKNDKKEEKIIKASKTNIISPAIEDEPKNSRPVVMGGKVAMRKSMTKNSDIPIPEFVDGSKHEDDDEYKDGDIRKDDIILT